MPSTGKSTPADYLIPNSPSWKHTYKYVSYRLSRLCLGIYIYTHAYNNNERGHRLKMYMEGFETRKGKGKWCNYIIISEIKEISKTIKRREKKVSPAIEDFIFRAQAFLRSEVRIFLVALLVDSTLVLFMSWYHFGSVTGRWYMWF